MLVVTRNDAWYNQRVARSSKKQSITINSKQVANQMTTILPYLKGKKKIFDVGTGPHGSDWWKDIDADAQITGIDALFYPPQVPNHVKIYKFDANFLVSLNNGDKLERYRPGRVGKLLSMIQKHESIHWEGEFDLVVANHVLEHVEHPKDVVAGIRKLLKTGGEVYIGFPEATNFTDIFYHLIHAEGGGHISKLTRDKVISFFTSQGFELLECNIWPDGWGWLETQYDYKSRGIKMITQEELKYICDVFRKELTPERGYFYGWEMTFKAI